METIRIDHQAIPEEFSESFEPLDVDEREIRVAKAYTRQGQGSFRARVLDAYQRRCAITGEHTEVVLDAAHIQPYLGPRSNHVQNGLVLTKEFHALYDRGYVTIDPDFRVHVSPRLREDFDNGHRYYPYDGHRLATLPDAVHDRPCPTALEWHALRVFLG